MGMQMVFEEYGFNSFLAMPAQPLSLLEWQAQQPSLPASSAGIGVVVDAGVSHVFRVDSTLSLQQASSLQIYQTTCRVKQLL